MVDLGGTVVDVIVENALYGELRGKSERRQPLRRRRLSAPGRPQAPDALLSRLTGGVHLHTIRCPDAEAFERIRDALAAAGLLYQKEDG